MSKKIMCIIAVLAMFPLLVGCDTDDKEIQITNEIHTESTENKNIENNQPEVVIVDRTVNTPQTIYVENVSYDYIIADSSTRYLSWSELSVYTVEELSYIRNEIFARHGYVFQTPKYANYFRSKSWYVPNYYYDGSYSALNSIEIANIELIKDMEGL